MPGDIGRIPILSLSTCKGLTDIISELPIPEPTHVSPGSRTLLSEPEVVHAAYRCINNNDDFIVQSIVKALREVSTQSMVFEESLCEQLSEGNGASLLLKSILNFDPCVFDEKIRNGINSSTSVLRGKPPGSKMNDKVPAVHFSKKQAVRGKAIKIGDLKKKQSTAKIYSAVNVAPLRLSLRKTDVIPPVHRKRGRPKKQKDIPCNEKKAELNEMVLGSHLTGGPSSHTNVLSSTSSLCDPIGKVTVCNNVQTNSTTTNTPIPISTSSIPPVCSVSTFSVIASEATTVSQCTSFSVTCVTPSQPTTTVKDAHTTQKCTLSSITPINDTSLTHAVIAKSSPSLREPVPPINTIPDVDASVSTRRITDPAFSQLFQPGLLFHSYLPQNEEEKQTNSGKGGLFDDWLDTCSENRGDIPPNVVSTIANSEGSASGPSSILGLSINGLHNPSISANGDAITCQPRSPLSVPSSFSSYPATPGAPGAVISSQTSMVVSPLSLPKATQSQPAVSSPAIRLFDDTDDSEIRVSTAMGDNESQGLTAPRGLAAYLPRSSSFRSSGYFSHLGGTNDMCEEAASDNLRHSPKQNLSPSPDPSGCRTLSSLDSCCSSSKPLSSGSIHNICASNDYHCNKGQSRKQVSGSGRFIAGKRKGGHRRRRTELEELTIWNLNENGSAPNDRKPPTIPAAAFELNDQIANVVEIGANVPRKAEFQNDSVSRGDISVSLHGGFTEALVERVKRRRQKQDLGHKVLSTRHTTSEISPRSTPSPSHQMVKNISKPQDLSSMYSEEFNCYDSQSSNSYRKGDNRFMPFHVIQDESGKLSSLLRNPPERSLCNQKQNMVESKQPNANCPTSFSVKRDRMNSGDDLCGLSTNFQSPGNTVSIIQARLTEQRIPDESNFESASMAPTYFRTKPPRSTFSPRHSSNSTGELQRSGLTSNMSEPRSSIGRINQSPRTASDQPTERNLHKPHLSNSMSSIFESSKSETSRFGIDNEQSVKQSPGNMSAFRSSSERGHKGIAGLPSKTASFDDSESSSSNSDSRDNTPVDNHTELSSIMDGGGCPTPSTIPYTHSSAMEDHQSGDSYEFAMESASRKVSRKSRSLRRSSTFGGAGRASSMSDSSGCLSDQVDSPTHSGNGYQDNAPFSSPSSLSTHSEGRKIASDSEKDVRSTGCGGGGQAVKSDTGLTQFTNRLGEILRRVEELDLLQLTSSDHCHLQAGSAVSPYHDGLPEAARLTRPELTALYVESARVRLSGLMYSIPTGRLVRFLTLLLVNMRQGSSTKAQPLDANEVSAFLAKRRQLAVRSRRTSFDLISESLLWSNPAWCSILTALDCARIALNIVVASDMPRPLLMEDMVDGIVNTVRCHVESGICNIPNISALKIAPGLTAAQVWCFSTEAIGFRVCQIMSLLSNLIRFQPHRFTDNIVIHLTSLGLRVPLYSLTTGKSIERDPRRLKASTLLRLAAADCSVYDVNSEKSKAWRSSVSRLLLSAWPLRLQWASLAVISGLYSQYESHRKLICDDIFSALSSLSLPPAQQLCSSKSVDSLRGLWLSTSVSVDRCVVRNFRLPASYYFYAQKHRNLHFQVNGIAGEPPGSQNSENSSPFVPVHSVTAIFLTLIQGLVHVPGSISTSSSSASTVSITPVTPNTANGELSQFHKDERQVLSSYHSSTKHAYCLLSGLFKRTCTKTEVDLRPLLDTLTADLLTLVTAAPVEWPVALTFLSALCTLLLQQLNNNPNSNNAGSLSGAVRNNAEMSSRLKALDTLATLAAGMKQITRMLATRFPSTEKADNQKSSHSVNPTDISGGLTISDPARQLLAQVRLVGFLSSHIPVVNHWLLSPACVERPMPTGGEGEDGCIADTAGNEAYGDRLDTAEWREQSLFCLRQNRLEGTNCLTLAAHRFHLASWLSHCSRELSEGGDIKTKAGKKSFQRVGDLRQLRHQLLSELVLTHHTVSSSATWRVNNLRQLGAMVGSSSNSSHLSSPAHNRAGVSRGSSTTAEFNGSVPSGNRLAGLAGSFLAHSSLKAQDIVRFAHSRHLEPDECMRFTAHSHWSALFAMSNSSIGLLPSFDKLFSLLCKPVGEPSIPMRTKALHCLTSLIDRESSLTFTLAGSPGKSHPYTGGILSDLPRLVHARLHENSTTVREAAVDLVSRLLLLHPRSLMPVYYPLLAERVLDKGISVRKSVIRCFRALLMGGATEGSGASVDWKSNRHPLVHSEREVEICVKLIRRMHDEESIQKLVIDIFVGLWFTTIPESDPSHTKRVDRRVRSICGVTTYLRSNTFDMLESFIRQILDMSEKSVETTRACEQLVSRLILLIQRYADKSSPSAGRRSSRKSSRPSLSSLLATLHVLSRCKPNMLSAGCCEFLLDLLHSAVVTPNAASAGPPTSSSTLYDPNTVTATSGVMGVGATANANLYSQYLFHLVGIIETMLASLRCKGNDDSTSSVEVACATSQTFKSKLNKLQLDLIRLIQRQRRVVVDVAVSCLATLTSVVLKNYSQVADCFSQFHRLLNRLSGNLRNALSTQLINSTHISSQLRPSVLRALYSVGLMCKHFTLEQLILEEGGSANTSNMVVSSTSNGSYSGLLEEIMDTLMLFAEFAAAPSTARVVSTGKTGTSNTSPGSANITNTMHDADLCRKAITGLCFLIRRHDNLLHNTNVKTFLTRFFTDSLSRPGALPLKAGNPICDVQCIILENLTHYLVENERQMAVDSKQWSTRHKSESLKEMADERSGQGSAVAQAYLPCVLQHCILLTSTAVRMNALNLISVVLRQGLVHPFQTLSSLICLQADPIDASIRSRATHLLVEAEQKAPGFAAVCLLPRDLLSVSALVVTLPSTLSQMKAANGMQMAYHLHVLCQTTDRPSGSPPVIRGAIVDCLAGTSLESSSSQHSSTPVVSVVNHALYSMLRSDRQFRRSFVSNLLALFDVDRPKPVLPNKTDGFATTRNTSQTPLGQLVFVADALTHFPYVVQDEIFYLAYIVEQRASVLGSSLVQTVKQALLSSLHAAGDMASSESKFLNLMETAETGHSSVLDKIAQTDERGDSPMEIDHIFEATVKWADSTGILRLFEASHMELLYEKARFALVSVGPICSLLLAVRQHLRDLYSLSDNKLKDYSPTAPAKQWEKPLAVSGRSAKLVTSQLLPLPMFTLHCLRHANRLKDSSSQTDSLLLWHFVDLCRRLLALEESGGGGESVSTLVSNQLVVAKLHTAVDDSSVDLSARGADPVVTRQQPTTSKNAVDHKNPSGGKVQPSSVSKCRRTQLRQKEVQHEDRVHAPGRKTTAKKKRYSRDLSPPNNSDSISSLSSATEASGSPVLPAARKLTHSSTKSRMSNAQSTQHRFSKTNGEITTSAAVDNRESRRKLGGMTKGRAKTVQRNLLYSSDETLDDDDYVRPQRKVGSSQIKYSCRRSKVLSSDSSDSGKPVSKASTFAAADTEKVAKPVPHPVHRKQLNATGEDHHRSSRQGSLANSTSGRMISKSELKLNTKVATAQQSSKSSSSRTGAKNCTTSAGRSLAPLPDAILRPHHTGRQQTSAKSGRQHSGSRDINRTASKIVTPREKWTTDEKIRKKEDGSQKRCMVGASEGNLHAKSKARGTDHINRKAAFTVSTSSSSVASKAPLSTQNPPKKLINKVRRLSDSSSSSAADEKHFRCVTQSTSASSVSSSSEDSSSSSSSTTSSDELSTSSNSPPPTKTKKYNSSR